MNLSALFNHIFPTRCLLCAAAAVRRPNLCPGCEDELPRHSAACSRCARPVSGPGTCGECLRCPPPFDSAFAALLYRDKVPALVHLFKFRGNLAAGQVLSSLLADAVDDRERPDCLVPVPSSSRRRRQRGFDPGVEIARGVARATGLPLERQAGRLSRRCRTGHVATRMCATCSTWNLAAWPAGRWSSWTTS